ncbi:MAG TPA: BrnA antitoxin family protein [Roseiarcus sp.]
MTDEEGEVRELTREDFRGMRPVREVMPELIEAIEEFRRKLGRPKAEAPKVHIGFRLASDVVASIRASGRGYNARVEQALRAAGFGGRDVQDG